MKDFFFSYTYPIMQSLQKNVLSMGEEGMPYENIFVWNTFLTESIRSRCTNTIWTIALVHGNFKQVFDFFLWSRAGFFLSFVTLYLFLWLFLLMWVVCITTLLYFVRTGNVKQKHLITAFPKFALNNCMLWTLIPSETSGTTYRAKQ